MKPILTSLIFLLNSMLFISCQEELQRVDLIKNSTLTVDLECEKDRQIDFYLDCDIEYQVEPNMVMDFEFFRGEQQILKGGLDPLAARPKENEIKVKANGITNWKFYGKLDGNFIPKGDTTFTIKPTLVYNQTPLLKFNKFELVFVR
ncbi:MAG: hypothetical protein P1U41_02915 [Vicingaceae bacterium]|nr:hypothetical protein [Vicingaceae bacterium]